MLQRLLSMLAVLATAAGLAASPAGAAPRTVFGFNIGITNAPPSRVFFRERPRLVYLPADRVYVVDDSDYDAFYTGDAWYVMNDGFWYRAPRYNGPYRVVDVRNVPRRVLVVPAERWKHHPQGGPPGQMKKYDRGGERHGRGHGRS